MIFSLSSKIPYLLMIPLLSTTTTSFRHVTTTITTTTTTPNLFLLLNGRRTITKTPPSLSQRHGSRTFITTINTRHDYDTTTLSFPQRRRRRLSLLSSTSSPNDVLVSQRLENQRQRKLSRQRYRNEQYNRNLELKRLIHYNNTTAAAAIREGGANVSDTGYPIPELFAVKVAVCSELRSELKLDGREKRGRLFIPQNGTGSRTIRGLTQDIHSFFRCLKKSSFVMSGALPQVDSDGSILPLSIDTLDKYTLVPLATDADVSTLFSQSLSHHHPSLPRPTLFLYLSRNPDAPRPPPPPSYLLHVPDFKHSKTMTMVSCYSFPPGGVTDAEELGRYLKRVWGGAFGVVGRVYVAREGVNAQMAVPTNVLENFKACCDDIPELGEHMENGLNIDPIPLTMDEFATAGIPANGKPAPPFKSLHIRTRHQIVADGLTTPLDYSDAGYDMPPDEWHSKLSQSSKDDDVGDGKPPPIILDCRNTYETAVGRFLEAEPVNTTNFRDTWSVLEKRLDGVPKDREVMTYCTGGIRCVKVNAYLKQRMGFTNVSRLAGGIVAYDRALMERQERQEASETATESLFKGTNYVFDGRVGRMITTDKLGDCITCNAKTNGLGNCRNPNCHRRMVQCSDCDETYDGCCSEGCRDRLRRVNKRGMLPLDDDVTTASRVVYPDAHSYATAHSTPPSTLYDEISFNTQHYFRSGRHMLSGPYQYRLLHHYASQTRFGRVLEVGTFTGYATAALWEGVLDMSRLEGIEGRVLSLERDERSLDLASKHLEICERFGFGSDGGGVEALKSLRREDETEGRITWHREMTDESVTFRYENSTCELRRVTDALASIEEMISSKDDDAGFDLIFLDADKTRLMEYMDVFLSHDNLLRRGGLVLVDNTLWKGMVYGTPRDEEEEEEEFREDIVTTKEERKEEKKSRRSRRLAKLMQEFNDAILKDERAEVVVLPVRDGLSVVRKR